MFNIKCTCCEAGFIEVYITQLNNGSIFTYAGCNNWLMCTSCSSSALKAKTEQEAIENWKQINSPS